MFKKADTALPLALPLPYTATAYTALFEHPATDTIKIDNRRLRFQIIRQRQNNRTDYHQRRTEKKSGPSNRLEIYYFQHVEFHES